MKPLITLIAGSEEWLMRQVLHYAKAHNYVKYTSTLLEAWRLSIAGLSQSLIAALQSCKEAPELGPDDDYLNDPIAAFGVIEAQRHRTRGVTLGMFLGLMKYYRQSYMDLVMQADFDTADRDRYRLFVERFFDRQELGFCIEWSTQNKDTRIAELQAENRDMTNEKNKYLTIFESLHDPVLLLNARNQIENINNAAAQTFFGESTSGSAYYEQKPVPKQIPWLTPEFLESAEKHDGGTMLLKDIQTRHGTRHFQVKLKRMLDVSDKYSGTSIIMNDITELIQAKEHAEYADRLKSTFLSTMSHELRTPLNSIIGFTGIILKGLCGPLSSEQSKQLGMVKHSANTLLNLINDILDISKIEAGQLEMHIHPFPIRDTIEKAAAAMAPLADKKGLALAVDIAPGITHITSDQRRVEQILLNLISNAVKFTEQGAVRVTCGMSNGFVQIDVHDTGIGIDPGDMHRIFQAFTQIDSGVARKYEGTGLGLPICKKLVEMLGGQIQVQGAPGAGSVFSFWLPAGDGGSHEAHDSHH